MVLNALCCASLQVKNAMNEINAAQRLRYRTKWVEKNRCSERILRRERPSMQWLNVQIMSTLLHCRAAALEQGEAEKIRVVKAAEADAEAK